MRTSWHRSEPRDVRPFFIAARAEDAVAGSKIRLYRGAEPTSDTLFDVEEPDLPRLRPAILPNVVPLEQWMPEGYSPEEFGLVILATNPFWRISTVVNETSLNEDPPTEVRLSPEKLEELGGGRNLTLTVAVHLRTERPPTPGRPFLAGHWLARKDFAIRMPSTGRFFDVQLRTDEEWQANGFPPKTCYAVGYNGNICGEPEPNSSIATIWVHADAHGRLSTERLGDSIQKLIAVEAIVQILQESFDEWKDLDRVEPRSALETVLQKIKPDSTLTIPELRSYLDGSSKRFLRALLQDQMGLLRALS